MKVCSFMNRIVVVILVVSSVALTRVYSENRNCWSGKRVIASVGECMPRNGNNIGPGSIVADAMLQETRHWKTQAALLDIFTIRKDLKEGPLTLSDAQRLVLDVPLIVCDLTGDELKAVIETMILKVKGSAKGKASMHVSGVRFSLNAAAACKQKVTGLEAGTLKHGYTAVSKGSLYRIVTTAPIVASWNIPGKWKIMRRVYRTHLLLPDVFVHYALQKRRPLSRCTENRINTVHAQIAVFSDPHYFAPSLLISNGPAFQRYLASDRKLIAESHAIALKTASTIRASRPDICLVPGDLTKDGELLSHTSIEKIFEDSLVSAGIRVYVAPGNHDINNPGAFSYNDDKAEPVETVTPETFADIHKDLGYAAAFDRDTASLTYVAEPENGLWILSIDACRYDNNQGRSDAGGRIKKTTLAWIIEKLDYARSRNITVLGMMHHGLMEHFSGQTQIMMGLFKDYVIDDWQWVRDTLAAHGLKTVFTGHFHGNDIAKREIPGDPDAFVFDVETGSMVTWPCPIRNITLSPERSMDISTYLLDSIDYPTGGLSFQEYARGYLERGFIDIITNVLTAQFGVNPQLVQVIAPAVARAYCAYYAGDEHPEPQDIWFYTQLKASPDPLAAPMGAALESLWTDIAPADNVLVIDMISGREAGDGGEYLNTHKKK